MMSKEELLKPRYKVIADYPGNVQPIGHIYSVVGDMASIIYWCNEKDNYPHLFKKLEWWEERKPEEMPEYLEWDNGVVCKPYKYVGSYFYLDGGGCTSYHLNHVSIATREEYEQYINQQKQANDTE